MTALFSADFTPSDARNLAGRLKAVADPARLQILRLLAGGPAAGVDIEAALGGLSQPTISHHLQILDAAGLIISSKEGVYVVRELEATALSRLAGLIDPAVRP